MHPSPTLLCTVRECGLALRRETSRLICPQGHSFDLSRRGYINLLQPQDRRSKLPGDTSEAVASRRRLHDLGVTGTLLDGIQQALAPEASDRILDAGCGEGFYLGSLHTRSGCKACGIDISIPAASAAAKRYPGCEWIVANADRFVPYGDQSFSKVLSITARMNPGEFRRVLHPDGRLLVAVPSPADLVELRGAGRDRIARTVEIFSPCFQLLDQCRISAQADLDAAAINDILHSIYRPMQTMPLGAMSVTFSLDILILRPTL